MPLIWKTNFPDPYQSFYFPAVQTDETYHQALQRDRDLYDRYIKGQPKASDTYTTEQLEEMGMVGLYEYVNE